MMDHIADIETGQQYLYENSPNIEEEIINERNRECYIFFSSNGIYRDTPHEFEKTMLENNRYEWKSIATSLKKRKDTGKIIYVRDVYKKHYREGVNSTLSSIEKVVEYLRKCTKNYVLTTIGISSGGYMASIVGCQLQAKRVFCFAGQFDLNKSLRPEDATAFRVKNPQYTQVVDLIADHEEVPIYYFCPINCEQDYENYKLVQHVNNVKCFLFPDKIHAATVYPFNYPDLFCLSNEKLNKLEKHYYKKIINKNIFLLRTMSFSGGWEFCKRFRRSKLNIGRLKSLWDV